VSRSDGVEEMAWLAYDAFSVVHPVENVRLSAAKSVHSAMKMFPETSVATFSVIYAEYLVQVNKKLSG
jgi:hypothetical protein